MLRISHFHTFISLYFLASIFRHSSALVPLSAVSFVPGLSQGLQKDAAPIGARIEGQRPPIGLCVYFLVFGIFEVFHFFSIKV